MTEEAKTYVNKLLQGVDGLMAIIITDRDGVPVFKVATDQTPDLVLRHSFLGTFGLAANQASKLGMSTNKSIICMYENHQIFSQEMQIRPLLTIDRVVRDIVKQVIQINKSPLLLTFIASSDTNTGLLLDMDRYLQDILQDLQRVVMLT